MGRGIGKLTAWLAAGVAAVALLCAPTAPAAIYWGGQSPLGAANFDGSSPNPKYFRFPHLGGPTCGVAVSASHLYWCEWFGLWRVNFEGPATPVQIVPGLSNPGGIAIDGTYVYWANPEAGTIGRARLDGSEANPAFLTGLQRPCNVAVGGGRLYWLDWQGIGRANIDGSDPIPGLVGTAGGCGLAVDANYLYWGQRGAIGRARLDGTEAKPDFIAGVGMVSAIALDGSHLYWTDQPEGMFYASIGRANLDGSGALRNLIPTETFNLGGVAVDARPSPPPLPLPSRPILSFGKPRHGKRVGSAILDVWVPERGDLTLLGPKLGWKVIKGPEPPPWRFGSFRWRLKVWPGTSAKGRQIRTRLRNKGWAKVALRLSYAEEGQLPHTTVKPLILRKNKQL